MERCLGFVHGRMCNSSSTCESLKQAMSIGLLEAVIGRKESYGSLNWMKPVFDLQYGEDVILLEVVLRHTPASPALLPRIAAGSAARCRSRDYGCRASCLSFADKLQALAPLHVVGHQSKHSYLLTIHELLALRSKHTRKLSATSPDFVDSRLADKLPAAPRS